MSNAKRKAIADLCTKMSEQMAAFDKRFTAMERRALEHGDDWREGEREMMF